MQALLLQSLSFRLLCLFSTPVDNFDVVVEYGSNDRDHVCLHHSRSHILRPSDSNIDYTLKCQIPLPHIHHILTSSRLEEAYQSFDASIDSQDIPYSC